MPRINFPVADIFPKHKTSWFGNMLSAHAQTNSDAKKQRVWSRTAIHCYDRLYMSIAAPQVWESAGKLTLVI